MGDWGPHRLTARATRALRRCCAAGLLAAGALGAAQLGAETLTVGALRLERCATAGAWCGHLERVLDPAGRVPGKISIYFEYYRHRSPGPAVGTLVAVEGGPGYATTESRAAYQALAAPLSLDRDLLLMDNRGTGRSGVVNCRRLQTAAVLTVDAISACGQELGARAPLYSTAFAADDLAALLQALATGPVDLYGDSYGTFFAQVFAVRHPAALRSLVLDGSFAIAGPGLGWWPHYAPAMRDKFNRACERSPPCRAIPGSSLEHLAPALARLRSRPALAAAIDADGARQQFRADAARLAIVMYGGEPGFAVLRELDAAARAFAAGDAPPLLRLMAETTAEVNDRGSEARLFSEGLAAAVSCHDYPQIFDRRLPPPARARERDRVVAERERTQPDTYAPFTFAEYRAMPPDYVFIDECVGWPAPDAAHPPPALLPPEAHFPSLPVLVLSGEFDSLTSVADGEDSAGQFPQAQHVVLANSLHVNALLHARSDCGRQLVQHFIATLEVGDAGCAAGVPPIRLASPFALGYAAVEPATAAAGTAAEERALRAVRAAVLTAADLFGRLRENSSGHGVGLRGGRFTLAREPGHLHARLLEVRWAQDLAVSGTLDWPAREGPAVAVLEFAAGPLKGRVSARWTEGVPDAVAELEGVVGGRSLRARMPAP